MVIKYNNLSREDYLYKFFEIVDCMQVDISNRTTESEKRLLIEFFLLPEAFRYYRFSRLGKKEVIKNAAEKGWKLTYQNINNKVYEMLAKGLLRKDTDNVMYAKEWLEKAIEKYEATLAAGQDYDFKFRFSNEK